MINGVCGQNEKGDIKFTGDVNFKGFSDLRKGIHDRETRRNSMG